MALSVLDMAQQPNEALIRKLLNAFSERDLETILAAIPPDAVWHFPGRRGRLAGTHRGRDEILRFLADVETLTNGTFRMQLEDVVAGDRHAVVLFTGRAEREGKSLENPTCLRVRFEDGRITEVWEFVWDLPSVDDFWA